MTTSELKEQRWFTSDLHFGHTNIIQYTGRPYSDAEEMNDDLVCRFNERVGDDDVVWILGDLCMGRLEISLGWVKQMRGIKYLIPGNHDRMFGCQGQKYANMVQKYLDAGIEKVAEPQVMMSPRGHDADGWAIPAVLACHFPYRGDSKDGHEDRYEDQWPKDRGDWLVHGHTHGAWRKNGRMIDVGVDAWGGYPVAFETVAELMSNGAEHEEVLSW